ncbi:ABC transporter permease [Streptosporangium sp. NBC_01639]|uniref:FtsX-like permease family protein n=1 Tax=Streptosporangium sp. NBC_01639 TaxID=2975948 RepID=UPI003870B610|nr:ABC transporter permease [Streptosporangium sp. NBC_01639]
MSGLMGLTWRLLRGGGRRGLLGAALTVIAVAVSTALLLFAVTANFAFQGRADREAWRNPVGATGKAVAIEAVHTDYVRDQTITVVDLAALEPGAPPPPGLARFPAPGEVWFSPGLAELAGRLPADQLAARFPAKVGGTVGDEALVHPGELVAVRGQRPDSRPMTGSDGRIAGTTAPAGAAVPPTKISDFTGEPTGTAAAYQALGLVASVLMVVPLLVFGGAAARLTVARRDQRLAALRLVGATPGQVVTMTVTEAVITAFGGAVLGTVLYGLSIPLITGIEIAGGTWFVSDAWPGVLPVLAALVAVPLLVGLSAVIGLRRVVVSPLGVARRETPPAMRFVRVVALLAILAVVPSLGVGAGAGMIAVVLGLAFLAVNLVGPWVVALIGRITARTARRPARLLAGRRLMDDPRAAWRTVSGVAMTGFVAGFIGFLSPDSGLFGAANATDLHLSVPSSQVAAATTEARERLSSAGILAGVDVRGDGRTRVLTASLQERDTETVDRARTALDGLVPGHAATSAADEERSNRLLGDIGTGTVTVLAVSFLVAIASAGITAASSILDRRQTYALLRLAGTPLEVLNRARRAETLIPLTVMGGGAIAIGVFCALPFAYSVMNLTGVITLLGCVVLGFAGVIGAGAASAPLLRSVTTDPAPRPD